MKPTQMLEIGPGLGSITRGLLAMQKPLQLLELDKNFIEYWKSQNCTVIEGDALHWHWQLENPEITVLVSNLPYQISKSIVVDRCLDAKPLAGMVLMFQKEVGQKLKATIKDDSYGMMSVLAQTFWKIETVLEASSGDFLPPPKVASRVLKFTPITCAVTDRKQFLKFMKGCFSQPRKLMISNMISDLGLKRETIAETFVNLKIKDKTRAEELTVKQFLELYFALGYK